MRNLLTESFKKMRDLDMQCEMTLAQNDKGYYRSKMKKKREWYDKLRVRFFALEGTIERIYKEDE